VGADSVVTCTHSFSLQASTVSRTDCSIRQGNWQRQPEPPIPNTPGVDVVGRIYRIDTETKKRYGLSVGDRVISLVKWGGNSRYLVMDPSTAVKVPDSVDPAVAVCLTETYLAAFQVLHCKQNGKARYQDSSLKDKTVLILGNAVTNMGRAIAQLAAHAGATQVFAMAKKKHFEQLSELGIGPLNQDSSDGWKDLFGMIDLIISIDVEVVEVHRKLLAGKGHIVAVMNGVKQGADRGRKARLACNRKGRMIQRRLTSYDIYEEWETNIDRCKLDLGHLIKLLDENVVEPNILDRVALHKVARAQSIVESKRLSGFIVCEPWLVAKSRAIRL
jgi:NADPH:quinone reductase-like Zn-dependent oxidoreductase